MKTFCLATNETDDLYLEHGSVRCRQNLVTSLLFESGLIPHGSRIRFSTSDDGDGVSETSVEMTREAFGAAIDALAPLGDVEIRRGHVWVEICVIVGFLPKLPVWVSLSGFPTMLQPQKQAEAIAALEVKPTTTRRAAYRSMKRAISALDALAIESRDDPEEEPNDISYSVWHAAYAASEFLSRLYSEMEP